MKLSDLIPFENIVTNAVGKSKKRILEDLSLFLSGRINGVDSEKLYQGLLARERLGSTGIGKGIAIPHCRMPGCEKITAAFFKLNSPVDFDSTDNILVDLVFALVVPEEEHNAHLDALSSIAELLQDKKTCEILRNSSSKEVFYQAIKNGGAKKK
jgi:PTS system nitrogen regulatory IIA component